MKGNAYKLALKKVGLSVRGAGPFLGFTSRNSYRIAAGESDLPEAARKLLLVMIDHSLSPDSVVCTAGNEQIVLIRK